MIGFIISLFVGKEKPVQNSRDDWFLITSYECPKAFSCAVDNCPMMLSKDGDYFLYNNFDALDFVVVMKPFGYYQEVAGIRFRNEEDAVAFKLRWL